jgi:hypothetical protein
MFRPLMWQSSGRCISLKMVTWLAQTFGKYTVCTIHLHTFRPVCILLCFVILLKSMACQSLLGINIHYKHLSQAANQNVVFSTLPQDALRVTEITPHVATQSSQADTLNTVILLRIDSICLYLWQYSLDIRCSAISASLPHHSLSSIPRQSAWDLQWIRWHLVRFFSENFGFFPDSYRSINIPHSFIYHSRMDNGLIKGHISTGSLTPPHKNKRRISCWHFKQSVNFHQIH